MHTTCGKKVFGFLTPDETLDEKIKVKMVKQNL